MTQAIAAGPPDKRPNPAHQFKPAPAPPVKAAGGKVSTAKTFSVKAPRNRG